MARVSLKRSYVCLSKACKEGREQGLQEGREQGLQEGREQAMQEGMQQGMQQEKLEIAGKMKLNGMPVDTIMLYTGLTLEQVETL